MTVTFAPANLQWVGLAKETTPGTAESAPTVWVPVASPKWTPNINPLVDSALRGDMGVEHQQVAGQRYDELTYTAYLYMDSVFQHFLATFGAADTVTGSADPYTHKTALNNGSGSDNAQPPSFTGFYIDGANKCFKIAGMKIVSLKLDVKADELATLDVTWNGLAATEVSVPTNTPSTNQPLPSWNSTITIGGNPTTKYSEVAITYTRDTKPIPAITGSQSPLAIFTGALSVAGTLTAVYQGFNDGDLAGYLANTQPALVVQIAPVGDSTHSLQVTHSKVAYDKVEVSGSNDWMEASSTIKALMNPTDALDSKQSPAQIVFLTAESEAF